MPNQYLIHLFIESNPCKSIAAVRQVVDPGSISLEQVLRKPTIIIYGV